MKDTIRILLVEDIETDAELVSQHLTKAGIRFVSQRAETREAFEQKIFSFGPDIILADFSLPQFTALDALGILRERRLDIPLILVTGAQSEEVAVECMRAGADDYILKTSLTRLPAALRNSLSNRSAVHEREKAEVVLAQREQLFRALIENAQDIITVVAENGTIQYASPSVERVLGYAPSELLQKNAFDLIHIDDAQTIRRVFASVLNNTSSQLSVEFRFRHRDGSWRTLESISSYLRNHPSLTGLIINSRDITERKEVEEQKAAFSQLGERLSIVRTAEEAAGVMVDVADRLFGWDACSLDMFLPETGTIFPVLTMDLMNGKRVHVPSVYRGQAPDAMARLTLEKGPQLILRGKREPQVETSRFGDTERCSESAMFVPIRHGDKAIGLLSMQSYTPNTYTDEDLNTLQMLADHCGGALERIRAGKALRDSEERYRIMSEQTGQLVYDLDLASGRILWSGAIAEITGFTPEEFAPVDIRGWEMLIHPEDTTMATLLLDEAMKTGEQYNVEYRFRKKDSSYIYVEDNGIFVKNNIDQPVRMLGTMKDISERKKAQEALRQSEERFRRLAENAQDVIYRLRVKPATLYEYLSPAVTVMTGYTPQEFYANPDLGMHIVHPEDRLLAASSLEPASLERGAPTILRWLRKDGMTLWIEQRNVPVLDSDGELVAIEGIARDITERMRAEEAVRESEERYRIVAETASDGIITVDDDGRILFANSATEKIFGRSIGEVLREPVTLLMPKFFTVAEDLLETDDAGRRHTKEAFELTGLHRDMHEIPLEISYASFVKNEHRFITAIVRDITERRQSEEAFRQSEERYRQFFEDDLTADFITKADGTIVALNPQFVKIFGFPSTEEASRVNFGSLYVHPREWVEFRELITIHRKLEYDQRELRRIDGRTVHVVMNAIGQFDGDGNLTAIKGYLFDNTELKMLQTQVHQIDKMDSIGKLASGIAHDFNNIMNNILGFTAQLKKYTYDPPKVQKYGETIERSATRGAELANQLLSFVRQKKRENVETSVADIIHEVVVLCSQTFPPTIHVDTRIDPDLLPVLGDRGELYQVLLNLAVNARDAMPSGGRLAITARNRVVGRDVSPRLIAVAARHCVEILVEDSGGGIPDHLRDKIFDPFFTTKEKGKGTGLGLSIVFGIVRNHKGSILVDSELGKGTLFSVYLPALEGESIHGDTDRSNVIPRGHDELILVVDDELGARELGRELLEEHGYRVLTAVDGLGAIEIFKKRQHEIALVILDLIMPELDGGQTYVELKGINPSVKSLFCSGHASSELISNLLAEENLRALQKPFKVDEFLRAVHEVLSSGEKKGHREHLPLSHPSWGGPPDREAH